MRKGGRNHMQEPWTIWLCKCYTFSWGCNYGRLSRSDSAQEPKRQRLVGNTVVYSTAMPEVTNKNKCNKKISAMKGYGRLSSGRLSIERLLMCEKDWNQNEWLLLLENEKLAREQMPATASNCRNDFSPLFRFRWSDALLSWRLNKYQACNIVL